MKSDRNRITIIYEYLSIEDPRVYELKTFIQSYSVYIYSLIWMITLLYIRFYFLCTEELLNNKGRCYEKDILTTYISSYPTDVTTIDSNETLRFTSNITK